MANFEHAVEVTYKYKYNGKELQDELGLNMYDYGARNYDPALGRWMNIDPKAEKYFQISPYVYVGNMPTIAIDPDGKDIVFSQSVREDGTTVIQMTVTGKLINESGTSYTSEQMNAYSQRLSDGIKESYGISGSDESGGKFEVNVSVNITPVSEDNPLSDTDTAYRIVDPDKIPDFKGDFLKEGTAGAADFNQNMVYLSSDIVKNTPRRNKDGTTNTGRTATGDATLERTGSHETGHSGGLHHPNSKDKSIMQQTGSAYAGMKALYDQILEMKKNYENGLLNQGRQE